MIMPCNFNCSTEMKALGLGLDLMKVKLVLIESVRLQKLNDKLLKRETNM